MKEFIRSSVVVKCAVPDNTVVVSGVIKPDNQAGVVPCEVIKHQRQVSE